jgi:aspartyl-tRNA(Asn)/glutamyl-tRNA(Gln) amidotransferase subunit A
MSIPCGTNATGLPVGLQLIAARGREELLFSLGAAFQRETSWHEIRAD